MDCSALMQDAAKYDASAPVLLSVDMQVQRYKEGECKWQIRIHMMRAA